MTHHKKSLFITGTTGIAGGWAVDELNQRGISLRIMTRDPLKVVKPMNTTVIGNLANKKQLKEISANNAGIIHYACASLGGKADPQVDIDAMEILLSQWEEGPFTFISSLDVYGAPKSADLVNESYSLSGKLGPYAEGKIVCETLLTQAAQRRGRCDFTIFRAPWIFAPSLTSQQHIQRRFLKKCDQEIILPGITPEEWKKYVDVWIDARDLAWLVAESIEKPLSSAGNVIGEHFNWHDFFQQINNVGQLNLPILHQSIETIDPYNAELYGQTAVFSGRKINEYYRFKPKHTLYETLQCAFQYANKQVP